MSDHPKKGFIERRHHKMYVTKNTEYHMRDDICVGIRKKKTGLWITNSKALKARLVGAIKSLNELILAKGKEPQIGEPLLFINPEGEDIVTTSVYEIKRPPKEAVQYYIQTNMNSLDDEISSNMGI
jgi:hypothetical protein